MSGDTTVSVDRAWLLGVLDDAMGWREPQYGGGCRNDDGDLCRREAPCEDHAGDQRLYDEYATKMRELRQ